MTIVPPVRPLEFNCSCYVAGYFDLLGQSNALTPYIDIRSDHEYMTALKKRMHEVVDNLSTFRSDVTRYFKQAEMLTITSDAPKEATTEQLAEALDYQTPQLKVQGFSDSIVVYVPVVTPNGRTSLFRAAPLVFSVASTMLTSFARGYVVRGAIDVSWGTEPFEGEFYGPALLSTYELERKANWPRVVLGKGILDLLRVMSEKQIGSRLDSADASCARMMSSWAFRDSDGQMAVDYLGSSMRSILEGGDANWTSLVDLAQVNLEKIFRNNADDEKVSRKLRATLDYFDERTGQLTDDRRNRVASMRRDGD